MRYFRASCVYLYVRGTAQHVSSLTKKEGMFYETSQNHPWLDAHPFVCISGKLCSHCRGEWNDHRLLSWDCILLPLPHLRPWSQEESVANRVLPEPLSPSQQRSKPTGDRDQDRK